MIGRRCLGGLGVFAVALLASRQSILANSAPVFSNITASQGTDGSKKVDIRYKLADSDDDARCVRI